MSIIRGGLSIFNMILFLLAAVTLQTNFLTGVPKTILIWVLYFMTLVIFITLFVNIEGYESLFPACNNPPLRYYVDNNGKPINFRQELQKKVDPASRSYDSFLAVDSGKKIYDDRRIYNLTPDGKRDPYTVEKIRQNYEQLARVKCEDDIRGRPAPISNQIVNDQLNKIKGLVNKFNNTGLNKYSDILKINNDLYDAIFKYNYFTEIVKNDYRFRNYKLPVPVMIRVKKLYSDDEFIKFMNAATNKKNKNRNDPNFPYFNKYLL